MNSIVYCKDGRKKGGVMVVLGTRLAGRKTLLIFSCGMNGP